MARARQTFFRGQSLTGRRHGIWLALIGLLALLVGISAPDAVRAEPVVSDLRITVNNDRDSTDGAFFVDIHSNYTIHVFWPNTQPQRDGHLKVSLRPADGGPSVTLWDKPRDLTRLSPGDTWKRQRIPMKPASPETSAFFGSGRDWIFRAELSAADVEPVGAETTVRLMQGQTDAGQAVVRIWGETFDYPGHPAEGQPLPTGGAVPATARSLGYAWVSNVESLPPGSSAHYRVTEANGRVIEESAAGLPSDLQPGRPLILSQRSIRNHPSGQGEMPAGMLSLTIEIRAGDGTVIDTDTTRFRLTDPDARDPFGNAVEVAACEGDAARVRSCLSAGCALGPNKGSAAVMCAAENGYLDVMRALIEAGANVNAMEAQGRYSALFAAAIEGHNDVVRMLLTSGAQPNRRGYRGGTALHAAVWGGHLALAERLLAAGADPNIQDAKGRTAGYYAYWSHDASDLAARLGYAAAGGARPPSGQDTSAPLPSTKSEPETVVSRSEMEGTGSGDCLALVRQRMPGPLIEPKTLPRDEELDLLITLNYELDKEKRWQPRSFICINRGWPQGEPKKYEVTIKRGLGNDELMISFWDRTGACQGKVGHFPGKRLPPPLETVAPYVGLPYDPNTGIVVPEGFRPQDCDWQGLSRKEARTLWTEIWQHTDPAGPWPF